MPVSERLSRRAQIEPVAPRWRVHTCDAPWLSLDAVYGRFGAGESVFWSPPEGAAAVAWGVAAKVAATGDERMSALQAAGEDLLAAIDAGAPGAAPLPRLWGGFAFAPGGAAAPFWGDFGDASFVLPRLTYWQAEGRAWLQLVCEIASPHAGADLAATLADLVELAQPGSPEPAGPDTAAARVLPPDPVTWRRQVGDILSAIGAGAVRKVVAAHSSEVQFEQAPAVSAVLAALADESGRVWRYALGRAGATLLGATPERLIRRAGLKVESDALAGTLAKAAGSAADLLASTKDRREHQLVCQGVGEALAPLCTSLSVPASPQIRELKRLYHLATPIEGRLGQPTHVIELCSRLHPTPATCGTPRAAAFEIITAAETSPRGWYAAPVGWFDASGDGEFVVALRSGLIAGERAYVFAGAGIVAGSDAEHELAETELKQRVMLRALGVLAD
ncbi:MAG: isochorismate synthase [Burkholderiaceae bacterium]